MSEFQKTLQSWPETSKVCCWNCSYEFKSKPVFLPYYFNERKKIFHTRGVFCSFGCVKRYNTDRNQGNSLISSLISYMYKIIQGEIKGGVHVAPPTHLLKRFGGTMSITQYRENCQPRTQAGIKTLIENKINTPPAQTINNVSTPPSTSHASEQQAAVLKRAFSKITSATKLKTETLKLKRNKEITANNGNELINNTLLHHMGIKIK
jgi:hypothetical protein